MRRWSRAVAALSVWSLAMLAGCSSEDESTPAPSCAEGDSVGGVCAGVPTGALCEADTCTVDGCTAVTTAANDGELATALAAATPGSCVALAPGSYGEVSLPSGVRLLGKGADFVTVSRVELAAGTGTMVRGLTVGAGGVHVMGTTDAQLDAVRVAGATGDGIEAAAGSRLTVSRSTVQNAGRYSVSAFDVGAITLQTTVLEQGGGPGLWAQCATGCDCQSTVDVTLEDTVIRGARLVGLSLVGVDATVSNVIIRDGAVDGAFVPSGGASVSGCAVLTASALQVLDNSGFGVLVDDASATFQPNGSGSSLDVAGNQRGLWLQHIGQSESQQLLLDGATVSDNSGVGLGISGGSVGVTIRSSAIATTTSVTLPVMIDGVSQGAQSVGDGLNWLDGSQVTIDGLTVSASARASVLIDGEVGVGSSIATVTLSGGDELKGILQQNFTTGAEQPTVGTNAPPVETVSDEQFSVALGLSIPPGI